ncbi:Receptor expression-enhancing protein [Thalictrum thalictroides]|uniref:HVA22-like protein n=1 Tax=Thalictrum thalictroides TaxID=46969 RepID=A0A7J6VRD4_THATH|nr:Receptor expression-enhancing protein [Thalictrum thalictroides]
MALLGSAVSSDVGLQLLLSPLSSNVVVRTACCSVGIVLPIYNTFKAIENKDQYEQQKWLVYWAAYGSFSLVEVFTDKLLYWFPLYYHMKFAFLVWLQLPTVFGARHMYTRHLRPFLLRHQARLDQIAGFTYSEMVKFVNAHQTEIEFAKTCLMKIISSAKGMMGDVTHPVESRGQNAIEGPTITEIERPSEHSD